MVCEGEEVLETFGINDGDARKSTWIQLVVHEIWSRPFHELPRLRVSLGQVADISPPVPN